ncbi:hypothetical protein PHYPSEUDO_004665 [Phytophthora pseudosyringae]|uniref:Uncharacterized protein n=1 Tax=Phytophthora pseudosyringae TaxID=221518 RepID=A0A8T1VT26_9STRA|nr:hypothetical protein PHYPSEUDO_004665 [Phytophthora pseudosyringae]
MAGKSRQPRSCQTAKTKSVKAAPKTVIRAVAATDTQPNNENDALGPATLTPYARMRQLLAAKNDHTDTIVMDTVEGLKTRLQEQEESGSGVVAGVIRMRLLWVSDNTYKQWILVRLHLVNANAPESLEDQLKMFRDPYEERRTDVDLLLLTVTLWNLESDSELLPPPGCIVDIKEYSNLRLYGKTRCQLTTRLSQLSWTGHTL